MSTATTSPTPTLGLREDEGGLPSDVLVVFGDERASWSEPFWSGWVSEAGGAGGWAGQVEG